MEVQRAVILLESWHGGWQRPSRNVPHVPRAEPSAALVTVHMGSRPIPKTESSRHNKGLGFNRLAALDNIRREGRMINTE